MGEYFHDLIAIDLPGSKAVLVEDPNPQSEIYPGHMGEYRGRMGRFKGFARHSEELGFDWRRYKAFLEQIVELLKKDQEERRHLREQGIYIVY